MDNLRSFFGIRRMDRVLNVWISYLCRGMKMVDEMIDGGVLWWFSHVERDRIAKRVYVGECGGSCSVGRPRKRWIDTLKDCLRKRGLNFSQATRMVKDRSERWGLVRENALGIA